MMTTMIGIGRSLIDVMTLLQHRESGRNRLMIYPTCSFGRSKSIGPPAVLAARQQPDAAKPTSFENN